MVRRPTEVAKPQLILKSAAYHCGRLIRLDRPAMRPLALPAWNHRASNSLHYGDLHRFLSASDEQKVLAVMRTQQGQYLTSDDVRYAVRSIVSQGGAVTLPRDFPPARWILEFKRMHGFSQLADTFVYQSPSPRPTSDKETDSYGRHAMAPDPSRNARDRLEHHQQQQQQHRSNLVYDHRLIPSSKHPLNDPEEELGLSPSSGSENDTTTGASSTSSTSSGAARISTTECQNPSLSSQDTAQTSNGDKRSYKLSHTVPAETWEKAIAAVEQQGRSLRAAAKLYGVHFAALHRRVKKRAQGGQSHKDTPCYFHASDETGIVRVVVAHAELGVLMTFSELLKLVEMAALRKLPNLSVEEARKLLVRFQSRNEESIRHIVENWPSSSVSVPSHYHLEHPGYDYGTVASFVDKPQLFTNSVATSAAGTQSTTVLSRHGTSSPLPRMNGATIHVLPSLHGHERT
ncbi:hypothetical protein CCR75_008151 [Bremia lactucae]|uniref:HTH psq-type domain-containing protein n=1 Tax=Bremia lactucae TaxID=4779 RepID=A0A976FFM3_BRELC|nr:hypothetical protein CCR75_008151 [Bremia lactucae]